MKTALTLLEGSPAPLEQSRLGQWGDGLGTSVQEFWFHGHCWVLHQDQSKSCKKELKQEEDHSGICRQGWGGAV